MHVDTYPAMGLNFFCDEWSPLIKRLQIVVSFRHFSPAANATVYRVYEYAVPVTTVATVPSAYPTTAGLPGIAAYPGGFGFGYGI